MPSSSLAEKKNPVNLKAPKSDTLASQEIRPVSRASLSDGIVEQIIDLIARDILKAGDRLPSEKELCVRFQVGRTTIREALRSLAVMGILDGRVGEGTFVSHSNKKYLEKSLQWGLLMERKDVQDLIETRLMLESQTAFSAAQRATEDDLQEIERAIRGMEQALDQPEEYLKFDLQFHLAIARATQNSILYNLLSMTRGYLQSWIQESLSKPSIRKMRKRAESSVREHDKILHALREHRPEEARQAMTEHILSSSGDLQAKIREAANR
jgi:GntR family transcriptional regulator, transcriptional repressor for pyruvate dehydrogenase complex